jgi:hypothetical protein
MNTQVTEKNTKSQILQAYNEALAKIKEMRQEDRKAEKRKEEEIKIVKQASENTIEKIVKSIGNSKIEIINELDIVGDKLTSEFKKLEEIKKAIEIESKYLDDIYEIKVNADTLSALLLSQKEKRAGFEAEMENKKAAFEEEVNQKKMVWKQEQEVYENQKKERDAQIKKERQREEEEYNYSLQLKRKKEADAYEERKTQLEKELQDKRAALEKELSERESLIAAKEKEFVELRAKVEQFPKTLENTIKETEKSVIEKLEFKYKHQAELSHKEIDGERNLNKQVVQSLENKIKEQSEQIKQLTQKANESGQQVQTIALKAIEGASSQRMYNFSHEKNDPSRKGEN